MKKRIISAVLSMVFTAAMLLGSIQSEAAENIKVSMKVLGDTVTEGSPEILELSIEEQMIVDEIAIADGSFWNEDELTGHEFEYDYQSCMYAREDIVVYSDKEESAIIGTLQQGQPIEVLGITADEWYKVVFCGTQGYIYKANLSFEQVASKGSTVEVNDRGIGIEGKHTKTINGEVWYAWRHTTNGTAIYDQDGTGWPTYLIEALEESGVTADMSEYDKAVTLHDYLCEVLEYDESPDGFYTTYDALHLGQAVGLGYANTYRSLLLMVGISNDVIEGNFLTETTKQVMPHAWNVLHIEDKDFYTDLFWDDYRSNEKYKMKFYDTFKQDHAGTGYFARAYDEI